MKTFSDFQWSAADSVIQPVWFHYSALSSWPLQAKPVDPCAGKCKHVDMRSRWGSCEPPVDKNARVEGFGRRFPPLFSAWWDLSRSHLFQVEEPASPSDPQPAAPLGFHKKEADPVVGKKRGHKSRQMRKEKPIVRCWHTQRHAYLGVLP